MGDIGLKVVQQHAAMDNQDRSAYFLGLLHAYGDVFRDFAAAFEQGEDIHAVFARIRSGHEQVESIRIAKGVA